MTRDPLAERRAELARKLAALSPDERARLATASVGNAAQTALAIPRRDANAPVPMSFAQELLWLLEQANPGMHGYNVPRVARLRGRLDVGALERALSAIVARHEILRSTFDAVNGELRQIVHPPAPIRVSSIALQSADETTRAAEARDVVRSLTRRPFDLASDAQLRASLIEIAQDDHALVLESHHVASDAWSRNILLRELASCYTEETSSAPRPGNFSTGAAARGAQSERLAELPIQYGDFAIWQRHQLAGDRLEKLLAYWRQSLLGAPAVLELPTDRPRAAAPSFEGDMRSRMLPMSLLERLRAVARSHDATLFMTLLAAFDVFLMRHSGQDDVLVGSPIAGRAHPGTEDLIGYFANTLVLRATAEPSTAFTALLGSVRETVLGGFEHQDIPYEKLVMDLEQGRAAGSGSLFQVMFTLQDAELRPMHLPGLTVEPFGASRGATKFDLSLFMHEQEGGLRAAFEYRTDLYDGATIERMLARFERLLESIADNPETSIADLSLIPEAEAATLAAWSNGGSQLLECETLHGAIALQAARTPDAVAIESEGASPDAPLRKLTFKELRERAVKVAAFLRSHGVGPDVGVAICIERSPELIVAMLGVLEAGGYYLPLDPEYPADRLAFMLGDAGVPVLLTVDALRDAVPLGGLTHPPLVLSLDGEWDRIESSTTPRDAEQPGGDHLAYVIYTSGSTGRPKGVMIPHRAVVNYLTWMRNEFPLDTRDGVLQKAPASFDACIWELFLPLVSGARLVLARPGGQQDPAYLLEALERHDVTLLQLVPSQLQMLLETPGVAAPSGLPRLRRLFLGGEALPSELLSRLAETVPQLPVTNLYGPTEATVYATHWSIALPDWKGGAVPIGTPITGATIHLLDHHRNPTPIGVPGELCIGGIGLARGYLARPELTEEKFIADPFSYSLDARLYRTGDRARYRPDGILEYQGRIDTQVKLRGFRVELGEIEHALVAMDTIQSAVVLVREDRVGDQRLVAYCIPVAGTSSPPDPATARQRLRETLPEFMIPTAFVWLDEFPMNANGKLDRRALRPPADSDLGAATRVAPRSPIEHALASIWSDVLHRELGVEDDFFEIGGHSLLALRTLARISDRLGVKVSLRAFFEAPTISQLARVVEQSQQASPAASRIPRTNRGESPLTPAQELVWLVERTGDGVGVYNVTDQWRVRGHVDRFALALALGTIVQRHAVLRSVIEPRDSGPVQVIHEHGDVAFEVVDLSDLNGPARDERLAEILAAETAVPFDPTRDHLLRAVLVTLAPDEHVFLLITHHLAADGWSRGLMHRELSAAYEAALAGRTPLATEPAVRFADFALWQRGQLESGGWQQEIDWWARELAGASLSIDVPTDFARPATPKFGGTKRTIRAPAALRDQLNAVAAKQNATLYMVLVAAFSVWLNRLTRQDDLLIQTTGAGRPRAELEDVVGYFAATQPLRLNLENDPPFATVIERVREATLRAADHSDVPFPTLATDLVARKAMTSGGGAQVMFILQNNESASLRLGEAVLEPRGLESRTAKLDLLLSAGEEPAGLRLALEYRTDLFAPETVERFLMQLRRLLDGVGRDASRPISQYDLSSQEERGRMIAAGRGPHVQPLVPALGNDSTIVAAIGARIRNDPDRAAILEDLTGRQVTYGELGASALRVAHALRARGVAEGDRVGIFARSSVDTLTAMLAIMVARAAYVPLDVDTPPSRLEYLLRDSRATVMIVEERAPGTVREAAAQLSRSMPEVQIVGLDALVSERAGALDLESFMTVRAHDLAYVMYTSGSTGKPKGVAVEHQTVANHIAHWHSAYPIAADDAVLLTTALTFDPSVGEIFVPLAAGACLLVADADARRDPRYLVDLLRRRPVAMAQAAPSIVRLMIDCASAALSSPRRFFVGGEAVPPDLPRDFHRVFPETQLFDAYGPTETTIYTLVCPLVPEQTPSIERRAVVPIGQPIGNHRAYVVERSGGLAPLGVPGELWIGGAGVARGYWDRDELTRERFIPDPFSSDPGRVYRTGDRVRWNDRDQIEYLGRFDDQMKIGGVRIEPGEVTVALSSAPGVREIVVVARATPQGKQLVAYVSGAHLAPAHLRAYARGALPPVMVPSAFVVLDALPRTAAGKIDRAALPDPDESSFARTPWVAPRSATEAGVARIWSEVLGHDRVGIDDNFFELGGTSLAAMRIVARMQEAGMTVPLISIFERGTVARVAALADERGPDRAPDAGISRVARAAYRRTP